MGAPGIVTSADSSAVRRGRFITFEGVDGAGKSTQIRLLADKLRALGLPVVLTREPGGSPGAEAVRSLLLDAPAGHWDALSEALLLYAARRDHLTGLIRPALMRGEWVLCDRFADSSHAYQGGAGGVPEDVLNGLDAAVLEGLTPDLTLILDLPAASGLSRVRGRDGGSRFEARGEAFQERVRAVFQSIAQREPRRCRLIDAARPPDDVARAVWREAAALIKDHSGMEAPP
jgi:dTMP kinase